MDPYEVTPSVTVAQFRALNLLRMKRNILSMHRSLPSEDHDAASLLPAHLTTFDRLHPYTFLDLAGFLAVSDLLSDGQVHAFVAAYDRRYSHGKVPDLSMPSFRRSNGVTAASNGLGHESIERLKEATDTLSKRILLVCLYQAQYLARCRTTGTSPNFLRTRYYHVTLTRLNDKAERLDAKLDKLIESL